MRRSPLKRGKPLQRKTRLSPRGKTKYRWRVRDLPYMKLVKRLPCVVRAFLILEEPETTETGLWRAWFAVRSQATLCQGRVEADHAGERPFGQKAPDDTCISECTRHHRERTDYQWTFDGFDKNSMRAFCDWAIEHTRDQVSDLREKVA